MRLFEATGLSVTAASIVARKTRHRGRPLVQWFFVLTAAAYNLIRVPKLLAATE